MSEQNTQTRSAYEAPKLARIGSLEEVTQAATTGTKFDNNYVVNTPFHPDIIMS